MASSVAKRRSSTSTSASVSVVQQGRLAGVGVADEGDLADPAPVAGLALGLAVPGDLPQVGLELVDAAQHAPPVDLELGLARATAGAEAASSTTGLLRQRPALAPQPGQAVPVHRQLDLGLALLAGGVLGEDVEDHRGAVDGGAAEGLLEVVLLGRAQLVVEHDGVAVDRLGQVAQLGDLALADVGGRLRARATLDDAADDVGAGRVDQQLQLVEAGLGVLVERGRQGHADEEDLLPEGPLDERARRAAELAEGAAVGLLAGVDVVAAISPAEVVVDVGQHRGLVDVVEVVEVVAPRSDPEGVTSRPPPSRCGPTGRGASSGRPRRPPRRRRACGP